MNAVVENLDAIPAPIIFTDSAADKVAKLIEEEGNPDLKLRVFVQGGGCSGFQYALALDEKRDDDHVFEDAGLQILVDEQSLPYVHGSQIDYVDALTGAGFQVNNPNVIAACGCGSSFRVPEDEEVSAV